MVTIAMPAWFAWAMTGGLAIVIALWIVSVGQKRRELRQSAEYLQQMRNGKRCGRCTEEMARDEA